MRRNFTRFLKLALLCVVTALLTFFVYKIFQVVLSVHDEEAGAAAGSDRYNPVAAALHRLRPQVNVKSDRIESGHHPKQGAFFGGHPKNIGAKKIDWNDYEFMALEKARTGIGEHGTAASVPVSQEHERKVIYDQNGFNGLLSDMISLNRSVKDIRHKDCARVNYLAELPTVSIVVPFYNEHWSTLLRTCYSVLNRSPPELITEIILVDDFSDKEFLKDKLDDYVAQHLPKVKILRLPERSGLITARIAGAKVATSDVLIFLDSHCEANTNWLPPLLEPIAQNYKVCMCPFIDVIAHETFEYRAQDEGARGAFDWQFFYKRLPILPDDLAHPIRPFKSPVMAGGLFAISAKFFWELGGYDDGLDIWGGEQYELSFKIWQCGGEMYDAPCSRIGHVYRGNMVSKGSPRTTDYLHKNYKRVAEVWMDEYKEFLYNRAPQTYRNIDAGDLTKQIAIRQKLQCKPFKWFMEEVAFDLPIKYPPVEPADFAYGTLQSVSHPHLCADSMGKGMHKPVGLFSCAENKREPQGSQFFQLSYHKDVRMKGSMMCWDVPGHGKNNEVLFYDCHLQQGNQGWRYYLDTKQMKVGGNNDRCLDLDPENKKLLVNWCDENNENMKWEWGFANETALRNFDKIGSKF